MDGREFEPRTVMWAKAEVSWNDQTGTPKQAPATLEDTSASGACIRVKIPITIGSKLTVKWHREQFYAVAKNCRSEGREFLLGVRREADTPPKAASTEAVVAPVIVSEVPPAISAKPAVEARHTSLVKPSPNIPPASASRPADRETAPQHAPLHVASAGIASARDPAALKSPQRAASQPVPGQQQNPIKGTSAPQERKVMQSKGIFPKFWHRQPEGSDAPEPATSTEAPVNPSRTNAAEALTTGFQDNLLSYDDIYHAAGILSPGSGYGVHKVVEMLNNDRIRELSPDAKRASVLMALDAAGTSPTNC
jgi:hypothetical protein